MKTKEFTKLEPQEERVYFLEELVKYVEYMLKDNRYVNYDWDDIIEHLEAFIIDCKAERDLKVKECR